VIGIIALFVVISLDRFKDIFQERCYAVGSGADSFLGDPHCKYAASALEEIHRRLRPGETMCVLPEGIMMNYLSRVESSLPYDCFVPPIFDMYGESTINDRFRADPPDYVLVLHRDTSEYGAARFGRDYARELFSWVSQNYTPVFKLGANPMNEDGEGLILMASRGIAENRSKGSVD
jgi:hypothetical protein